MRWGTLLTAGKRTDAIAAAGATVDELAATAFGAVLFLHAFDGTVDTDVTIKVEDSANGSAWSDLSGAAFVLTSGTVFPYAARIALATNAAVRRYVRATTTTVAGFTTVTFAVVLARRYAAF